MSLNSISPLTSTKNDLSPSPPRSPRSQKIKTKSRKRASSLFVESDPSKYSFEDGDKISPRRLKRERNASLISSNGSTRESVFRYVPKLDSKLYKFKITSAVPVHSSTEKEFTAFLITVTHPNGEQRTLLRRYRQFSALHQSVLKAYPNIVTPHFPKKRIIGNMSTQVIERRRRKLEIYLNFVVTIEGIEDFLAFDTFLGTDLKQRGVKGKRGHAYDLELEELYSETDKEKELRIAQERRFNEVKTFILKIDEWCQKLFCLEDAFNSVLDTSDFIKYSEFSKLVVSLGKYLGKRKLPVDYVPRELDVDQKLLIRNPKILSIRQKITPALDEIQQKLSDIKNSLLDLSHPMNEVLELENIVDDIQDIYDNSCIVPRSLGFRIESGSSLNEINSESLPTYVEDNIYWYKKHFFKQDHVVCYCKSQVGDFVISLIPSHLDEVESIFRLFICTKDGNECILKKVNLPNLKTEWKEKCHDIITKADLRLRGVEWVVCEGKEVESFIVEHEMRDMRITRKLKFGVLLCLKNQTKEESMFDNEEEIPSFKNFLDFMGERIKLSGYTGFSGGLDTKGANNTGEYSVVSKYQIENDSSEFEIMFHVSTLLPSGEQDQQLAKKRHIGNDIVLLVFQEDGSHHYSPLTVKSNYIQIIIVVRSITIGENRYAWHVNVCSAQDVPVFGPPLPYPPIFEDKNIMKSWLTEKMVNAELAAYKSKLFVQQLRSTYKTLLGDLMSKLPVPKKKKSKSIAKKKFNQV